MAAMLRRGEGWMIVLATITLAAWCVVALGSGGVTATTVCSTGAPWTLPSAASFDLFLALNPPQALAAGWALMLAAMTPPLIVAPLRRLRACDPARGRGLSMLGFVAGYGLVWMAAGALLETLAVVLRLSQTRPSPLLGLALLVALVWQASPAKQACLNHCHDSPRSKPTTGWAFGLEHGAWCVGACWALMLPPLLIAGDHLPAMAAVALFLFAERLEPVAPPAWRLRVPGRALLAPLLARLRALSSQSSH